MQEANIANTSACIDNNIMLVSLDGIAPYLQEICHNHTLQQQQGAAIDQFLNHDFYSNQ